MDCEPIRNEREEYELLHRHYTKLMSNVTLRQSQFIFIPENNLGMEHHHLDAMVKDIPGVTTFWETEKKPGITKTEKSTREYQFLLSNCLANGGLRFDRTLFTCTREKTPQAMLDMLEDQMSRYHWAVKKANDEHGEDRTKLTGKVGNLQDDLLIAIAMIIYTGRIIIRDPKRLETQGG